MKHTRLSRILGALILLSVTYFPVVSPWMHHHHLTAAAPPAYAAPADAAHSTAIDFHTCVCITCARVLVNPPAFLIVLSASPANPMLALTLTSHHIPTQDVLRQIRKRGPPTLVLFPPSS